MGFVIVFLGAGVGGAMRHGVNLAALRLFGLGFPFGTMFVNIAGSFAMGLLAEYFAIGTGLPQHWRLFLTTGVLGGFTTFSAFSLETVLLWERGQGVQVQLYIIGSVFLSVGAFFAALWLMRTVMSAGA